MSSRIIYIVGPTASGKTSLAIKIAKKFNGEIICADSRTIYKNLDIGTAKPSMKERNGILHYGLDLIYPSDKFSAMDFAISAKQWIKAIRLKGKIPIVVGGTGLYVDGLYYNFSFSNEADYELRERLDKLTIEQLHEIILTKGIKMPENNKNKRYLIRAIERGGVEGSKKTPLKSSIIVGINPPKEVLSQRIHERTLNIYSRGVLEEAKNLFSKYGYDCPGSSANAYRALRNYYLGLNNLEECKLLNDRLDIKLAKRQMTWFKRNENILWFDSDQEAEKYLINTL